MTVKFKCYLTGESDICNHLFKCISCFYRVLRYIYSRRHYICYDKTFHCQVVCIIPKNYVLLAHMVHIVNYLFRHLLRCGKYRHRLYRHDVNNDMEKVLWIQSLLTNVGISVYGSRYVLWIQPLVHT